MCRVCNDQPETFYHWLGDCRSFDAARQQFFADGPKMGDDWDMTKKIQFAAEPRVVRALAGCDVVDGLPDDVSILE